MPFDTADIIFDLIVDSSAFEVAVHWQELWVALDLPTMLMNVKRTKMCTKLSLTVGSNIGKVLVLEHDNAALRGQQGQLVSLLTCQGT